MSDTKTKRNGTNAAEDQRMEKVKEILFGHELRGVEENLAETQARFEAQLTALKKAAAQKISALEIQLKRQQESLAKDLAQLDATHTAKNDKTNVDQLKLSERLEKLRVAQKEETRELKTYTNEQIKLLNNSIKANAKQLNDRISTEIEELRRSHVDKNVLADMFETFASALVEE